MSGIGFVAQAELSQLSKSNRSTQEAQCGESITRSVVEDRFTMERRCLSWGDWYPVESRQTLGGGRDCEFNLDMVRKTRSMSVLYE